MASEPERIEEVRKYIEATITEIDSHTEDMEKLFKMDRWSKDSALYEIIINSYERHRNTLKRIQKIVDGGKACEVPFEPKGDKPVYCSDCFQSHRRN